MCLNMYSYMCRDRLYCMCSNAHETSLLYDLAGCFTTMAIFIGDWVICRMVLHSADFARALRAECCKFSTSFQYMQFLTSILNMLKCTYWNYTKIYWMGAPVKIKYKQFNLVLFFRNSERQTSLIAKPREYWMSYRRPGFLAVVWFSSSPTLFPPFPAASFSVFFFSCVAGRAYGREMGQGVERSQIVRLRESPALYKSFKTLLGLGGCTLILCHRYI